MSKRSANAVKETDSRRRGTTAPLAERSDVSSTPEETGARDKIATLEAELALYRAALEKGRAELQAFAYSVSHDLRAPLRAIEGFSRILLDDFAKELSPDGQRFLKNIIANTEILGSQVEDLLRYYRSGKDAPTKIQADSDAICREAIATFSLEEAGRINIPNPLPRVDADPVNLRDIFRELLANSLKFSRDNPAPKIEVRASVDPDATRFSVSDNGVGFDPRYTDKLFHVFQKLHPASEFPGNGIGLAIVKRAVEAHGGCVEAQSVPGEGATFSFTLPNPTK